MDANLSDSKVADYKQNGFLSGLKVFSNKEARNFRAQLERIENDQGHPLDRSQCNKSYLLFDWADEVVHNPVILDAVESLIGPDILCLMTNLFTKEAGSESYVSMHQDAAYWGVDADDVVTAWVALSPATAESGVMKVEPGSHVKLRTQINTYEKDNLLSRGQAIPDVELNPASQVYMELAPGEMSLHHFKLVHGSDANTTDDRRIGFAIRYVAAKKNTVAENQSALLVRGVNNSAIKLERRTKGLSARQKAKHHANAMRLLIQVVLRSDDGTPIGERLKLFVARSASYVQTYARQIGIR